MHGGLRAFRHRRDLSKVIVYGDKDHPVEAVTEDAPYRRILEYRRKEVVCKGNIELTQNNRSFAG